jgi:methionyl-tRNA synthetase
MPYQDLCISRSSFQWGIPVPGAEGEVLYVWFDALINYISAIGYGYNEELFWKFWPADLHIVGKDILKFHTLIWYSLLKAGDLPLPKVVFAHGWWKVEGKKISKSLGNIIDPNYLISRYTVDGLRYFLIREIPFGQDGDFRESAIKERLNADLANDLGNLFLRTTTFLTKYFQSRAPKQFKEGELYKFAHEIIPSFKTEMENIELHSALLKLWELVRQANKYIDKEAPWHKVKVNKREVEGILGELIEVFRIISILLYPFLPSLSKDMITSIGLEEKELLSWDNLFTPNLESRNVVAKILFQKIE